MNQEAQAHLDSLLTREPEALTESDLAFLAARRDYLTEEQQIRYGVTGDTVSASEQEAVTDEPTAEAEEPTAESASDDAKSSRTRKGRKASE
jgi:hypothetical protein